jgi:transposase-like protein
MRATWVPAFGLLVEVFEHVGALGMARQDFAAWIAKWGVRYPKLVAWVEETGCARLFAH